MAVEVSTSTRFLDLVAWLQNNFKQVLIGSAVAVALAIGATIFFINHTNQELRASEALWDIRLPANPSALPPGTAEAYLKVAKEHPGTKAGARALLQASAILYEQGRYEEAQQQFEHVLREYPDSPWQAEATLGVAATLEAQQKLSEATGKYEELRRRFANSAVVDEAKLNLARLYEQQKKPAEAFRLYDELVKLTQVNPYSGIGNEAGVRLEDLLQKHPELAKTNLPATVSTTPGAVISNLVSRPASNRVITLTNLPRAATNVPGIVVTNVPSATGSKAVATNAPLLLKPDTTTNKSK